ncbi:MAG: anthranilate synthase component II [Desulfovermiculus sp.]
MKILMVDNYDSFTFNLVQLLRVLGAQVIVYRNDAISSSAVFNLNPAAVVISPGPKDPAQAGASLEIIASCFQRMPLLGVCLGLQCVNEFFGGTTARTKRPIHGQTSPIFHLGCGLFAGLPSPLQVARYHSLQAVPGMDSPLEVTAWTQDGLVMGLSHPDLPVHGVQFHPESFLTQAGRELMVNFLAQCWDFSACNSGKASDSA